MILVDRVATKSMDSRGDWGRTSVRQRSGQKLYANWLEMLPCPRIWNSWCFFIETCMILVDRVAIKSMDSRGGGHADQQPQDRNRTATTSNRSGVICYRSVWFWGPPVDPQIDVF